MAVNLNPIGKARGDFVGASEVKLDRIDPLFKEVRVSC
jgi:hypothetical protein